MKVKLHKGPLHGKVMDVSEHDVFHGLTVSYANGKNLFVTHLTSPNAIMTPNIRTARYEMVIMGLSTSLGANYKAPAMHPDGYVYMVHKK